MLQIKNLTVKIEDKVILNKIQLVFNNWWIYFLLGKNWSGKSSLAQTIAWNSKYQIIEWEIFLNWNNLNSLTPDERSKSGIFLSFQNIPEIPGIKLKEFLRVIYNFSMKARNPDFRDITPFLFGKFVMQYLESLNIPKTFLDRDLNVGFSGWEKRKIELLQIKLLDPKIIILDEIDSGLDIDAFKIVANELVNIKKPSNTLIFITHNFDLVDYMDVNWVFILEKWELVDSGWKELIDKIKKEWYCEYCKQKGISF